VPQKRRSNADRKARRTGMEPMFGHRDSVQLVYCPDTSAARVKCQSHKEKPTRDLKGLADPQATGANSAFQSAAHFAPATATPDSDSEAAAHLMDIPTKQRYSDHIFIIFRVLVPDHHQRMTYAQDCTHNGAVSTAAWCCTICLSRIPDAWCNGRCPG